ncbi:DUF1648 domain-containing protein [Nonomuraea turkmeniaca]|uniref:DUF1648 domain-containing protein n=1 Tax=Nonomuraea turkmeniaca TaxID=103838 RepID=A0A5S4EWG6_9ACTN|nr:DUF1648 domain-containing protein [Nonomuraea turkmeniaca]TMR07975.1 DUF1648 domain-containing protein [Nonomuraea turkmeniaca]
MTARVAAAAWGLLVLAGQILLPLSVRDRLPDPLATHWGPGDRPDGSMPFTVYVVMVVLVWAVPWLGLVVARARALTHRQGRMFWWGVLFATGVFAFGMNVTTVLANLGAPDWRAARLPGWAVLAVIGVALAAAVAAGYLGRGAPDEPVPAGTRPPLLRLRAGQRTVWVGHVANPWLTLFNAVMAAGLAVLAVFSLAGVVPGKPAALILPVLVLVLAVGVLISSVSVRAGDDRVVIQFGPLGWPARRIPLSKIESAWAEVRHPSRVGGWGIRGLPGGVTIMLRGGECLVLGYRSGGQLAISIDDAARGASLINALINERVES